MSQVSRPQTTKATKRIKKIMSQRYDV
jgi:ubiquitin-conjugating enzyme E2 Z